MNDTIIKALLDYFSNCPLMESSKINIDFLPDTNTEYSIDPLPLNEVITRYVNGDSKKQYSFTISSINEYGSDVLKNLDNSSFFEKLSNWLTQQSQTGALPILPSGKKAEKIMALSTGNLQSTNAQYGKYQIQCKLIYMEEK